ncbi:MAG TPA: DNA-processing protein DprA [Geminicoccaceae bacterium]
MPNATSGDERIAWLRLARTGGVGPRTFRKLLRRFGNAARALDNLPRIARETGSDPDRFRICSEPEATHELEALAAAGGRLLLLGEPDYPLALQQIEDAPPVLSARGDPALLARPAVALVGARNASGNGRVLAQRLAAELAGAGMTVVSGLARGIDTAAHEGALQRGATIAVVASGIDVAYPPENALLMERIAEHGLVVTERPFGREPQARHFPRRNRVIAGLSLGVVVVEAAPKSGSLITARLAAEQGREVMAVPGSPLDPRHRGTNRLLREGATLVEDAADVLEALRPQLAVPEPPRALPRRPGPAPPTTPRPAPPPAPAACAAGTEPVLARIRTRLGPEPLLVDELIRQCHASSAEVQHALMELELEGRIERHPGNRVSLAST